MLTTSTVMIIFGICIFVIGLGWAMKFFTSGYLARSIAGFCGGIIVLVLAMGIALLLKYYGTALEKNEVKNEISASETVIISTVIDRKGSPQKNSLNSNNNFYCCRFQQRLTILSYLKVNNNFYCCRFR